MTDGTARTLLDIIRLSCDEAPTNADVETARNRYEKLHSQGSSANQKEKPAPKESSNPQDETESANDTKPAFPRSIDVPSTDVEVLTSTKKTDPASEHDLLIAMPIDLLSAKAANEAIPVNVQASRNDVGVPMGYFDGTPPLEEIREYVRENSKPTFQTTTEHVDWADYTINPMTGCLHTCSYCYARHMAEELKWYKQGFTPVFYPGRLEAFANTKPPTSIDHVREKNVFVGSMADIFGKWVPDWAIKSILEAAEGAPGFNFLFLTKFPQKLSRFEFPENAWIGATVDRQSRVSVTEKHFAKVDASVKWLSCEPLLEKLEFDDLSVFDGVVMGAQKSYGDTPGKQPEASWVRTLWSDAEAAGCEVYFKKNYQLPKRLPGSVQPSSTSSSTNASADASTSE